MAPRGCLDCPELMASLTCLVRGVNAARPAPRCNVDDEKDDDAMLATMMNGRWFVFEE